ncbi:DUF4232 domain-containing protein [Mycobacterium sp. 236(2023)]|uniref:DUF4232 domain-containing protein n=1 Tax=Mycobacterium sp. 236(2023) TaxID=3038163 RepID=UPI0024150FB3|nr:DUF4232 domain-containing protein [Mycobacterium sp. 236(2023)]MDG4662992.1 DUF4232 domain-containing protein [Mycobacterium sp. 236(2023)]
MLGRSTAALLTGSAAILLLAGCAQDATEPAAATVTVTPSSTAATTSTPTTAPEAAPTSTEVPPSETPAATAVEPGVIPPCSDAALTVSAGPVEEADTMRRVVISFANTSSEVCGFVSYPSADLLGGPGNVLVHVAKRPANAAPRLTLQPGDVATADVQTSTIDSATGESCGRIGTLAVTPPDNTKQRVLEVNLPICDATISAVG